MNPFWLSETRIESATTAILLGAIPKDLLLSELNLYHKGIFVIDPTSQSEKIDGVEYLDPCSSAEVIKERLNQFLMREYNKPPVVKVSKNIHDHLSTSADGILKLIIQEIDTTLRARRTRNETGFDRQKQIFLNLPNYLKQRVPDHWEAIGSQSLAVVVGAGPSLDETLTLLNSDIPNPIIIATDSSLKALHHEDITPHFVVSIDPHKTFEVCSFPGFTPGQIILSSQSHKSWNIAWKDKKAFLSGRVISEDWLAEKGVSKTSFLAINNVGLTALAFANFLRPSVIILLGMDLSGKGRGEKRYAEKTGRSQIEVHASKYHEIPGNYEKSVPTPFFSDWQETSEICSKISKKRLIINFNIMGAQLSGTTLVHPEASSELKEALKENIKEFDETKLPRITERKKISEFGLNQILSLLASKCDQIWKIMPNENSSSTELSQGLINLFSDKEISSLLGDFAFSTMPKLMETDTNEETELKGIRNQLQQLVWTLEDAILDCNPDEDFILRFFTEKFT